MLRFLLFSATFVILGAIVSFFDIFYHVRTLNEFESKFVQLTINYFIFIKTPSNYPLLPNPKFLAHHHSYETRDLSPFNTKSSDFGMILLHDLFKEYSELDKLVIFTYPASLTYFLDKDINEYFFNTLKSLKSDCPSILDYYNNNSNSNNQQNNLSVIDELKSQSVETPDSIIKDSLQEQIFRKEAIIAFNLTLCNLRIEQKKNLLEDSVKRDPHQYVSCNESIYKVHECVNRLNNGKFRSLFLSYFAATSSMCLYLQETFSSANLKEILDQRLVQNLTSLINTSIHTVSTEATRKSSPRKSQNTVLTIFKAGAKLRRHKAIDACSEIFNFIFVFVTFYYSVMSFEFYPNHFVYKISFYLRLAAALIICNATIFKFLKIKRKTVEYLVLLFIAAETVIIERIFDFQSNILPHTPNFTAKHVEANINQFRVYVILFVLVLIVKMRMKEPLDLR